METKYLFTTWPEYHLLAQKLAAAIMNHSPKFDMIVAVSRGGLTLGHMLSDLLQLPVSTFAIQSYTDIQTQGTMKVTQQLGISITGKRVLLVDDVSDSGKTFKRATEYVKSCKPSDITTVAMFFKTRSIFRPDYFVKKTNRWIIFPYEPTEMIIQITKKMDSEGKSKAEIQDFLITLGFREGQIAFVRKHHIT
jgi:hypoxanthine phosphoribosyltransferase